MPGLVAVATATYADIVIIFAGGRLPVARKEHSIFQPGLRQMAAGRTAAGGDMLERAHRRTVSDDDEENASQHIRAAHRFQTM